MRRRQPLPKGSAEYYQKLLDLLNEAVSGGDLSGGSAFDKTTLLKLEEQAQSFASLPTGTAGVRVMDDSFNYPLSLLLARLLAMRGEADNFTTVSGRLLDILAHETRSLPRREHNIPARGGGPEPAPPQSGFPAPVRLNLYMSPVRSQGVLLGKECWKRRAGSGDAPKQGKSR